MFLKILKYFIITLLTVFITIITTNIIVVTTTINNIISKDKASELEDVDCILILGAGIRNGGPSPMLEDRLLSGIYLYENNVSSKILVSGDHMNKGYDEVNIMKNYLINYKIPSQAIFMDHAGISTYDSIYRAKHIFKANKIIIVTQRYHLHRALYIAKQLGIEAYGVESKPSKYRYQGIRELREILARSKDLFKVLFKVKSTFQGEEIPIQGNGDITND